MALALLTLMPMAFAATPARRLAPDGGLQAEITAVVLGITGSHTAEQHQTAIETASKLGHRPTADRVYLLEQVAIFLADAGGTEEAMGGALLLHVLDFQRHEILAAALPHMVAANSDLNKILRELAATIVVTGACTEDPVGVVLEIEEWRATAARVAPDVTRRAEIGLLLSDLAEDDNRWVRAYVAAVVAADPELMKMDVSHRRREE